VRAETKELWVKLCERAANEFPSIACSRSIANPSTGATRSDGCVEIARAPEIAQRERLFTCNGANVNKAGRGSDDVPLVTAHQRKTFTLLTSEDREPRRLLLS
jgi:hypothetical protein